MLIAGWDIDCDSTGVPVGWTPLTAIDVAGMRANSVAINSVDWTAVHAIRCKSLVRLRHGVPEPGSDLESVIQQLFGIR